MDTMKAPDSSASLTMIPIPARFAAAAAAAVPRLPLLFVLRGSAGGDDVSVSATSRPRFAAELSMVVVE